MLFFALLHYILAICVVLFWNNFKKTFKFRLFYVFIFLNSAV